MNATFEVNAKDDKNRVLIFISQDDYTPSNYKEYVVGIKGKKNVLILRKNLVRLLFAEFLILTGVAGIAYKVLGNPELLRNVGLEK